MQKKRIAVWLSILFLVEKNKSFIFLYNNAICDDIDKNKRRRRESNVFGNE